MTLEKDGTICAVLVTYNRLELLKKCVDALRRQSKPVDSIIIVNNGSTDGTRDWLAMQSDLRVINQENLGGAGGFNRGIKEAYAAGHQWIWIMDDDVEPDKKCLEMLFDRRCEEYSVRVPVHRYPDGSPWSFEKRKISRRFYAPLEYGAIDWNTMNTPVGTATITFEGALFGREVVGRIGYPDPHFFILFDDTDYAIRVHKAGFRVILNPSAVIHKQLDKPERFANVADWKRYYYFRNRVYIERKHCHRYFIIRPALRALRSLVASIALRRGIASLRSVLKGFYDGMRMQIEAESH